MKTNLLKLLATLWVFGVTLVTFAGFHVQIAANGNANFTDQWQRILSGRGPNVNLLTHVPTGRFFELLIFVSSDAEDVDLVGKLTTTDPVGKVSFQTEDYFKIISGKVNPKNLILSTTAIGIAFEPDDAEGEYTLSLEVQDLKTKEKIFKEIKIKHTGPADFATPKMDFKALNSFVPNYYKSPNPELLPAAWRAFITEGVPKLKNEKNFNPYAILYFFVSALEKNEFVWDAFIDEIAKSDGDGFALGGMVIAAIPDLAAKAKSKGFPVPTLPEGTFSTSPINLPIQQDMLWSEFFATGKFKPIDQLISTIVPNGKVLTVEEFKSLSQPTAEDKKALLNFVLSKAGIWSLTNNAKQHPLVFFYLECIVKRDVPKNPEQLVLLNEILVTVQKQAKSSLAPQASAPQGE